MSDFVWLINPAAISAQSTILRGNNYENMFFSETETLTVIKGYYLSKLRPDVSG